VDFLFSSCAAVASKRAISSVARPDLSEDYHARCGLVSTEEMPLAADCGATGKQEVHSIALSHCFRWFDALVLLRPACGELLRLQLRHYEVADQLLRIEETKFNKSVWSRSHLSGIGTRKILEQRRHCGIRQTESVLMWCGRAPEPSAYALRVSTTFGNASVLARA